MTHHLVLCLIGIVHTEPNVLQQDEPCSGIVQVSFSTSDRDEPCSGSVRILIINLRQREALLRYCPHFVFQFRTEKSPAQECAQYFFDGGQRRALFRPHFLSFWDKEEPCSGIVHNAFCLGHGEERY